MIADDSNEEETQKIIEYITKKYGSEKNLLELVKNEKVVEIKISESEINSIKE